MAFRSIAHSISIAATALLLSAIVHAQQPNAHPAGAIRDAVKNKLERDALVSLDAVHVDATDTGNVTLTGDVNTLLAKQRAGRISQTVKGVQRVDNQVAVIPRRALRPEDLQRAVKQALVSDPATDGFQVDVQADQRGRVTLTGQANSRAEYELIGRVAKGIAGVTQVTNNVRIEYVPGRPDPQLQREIQAVLQWDAYIDDASINVEVRDGAVTLSGTVGSAAEKERARVLAWTATTKSVNVDALRVASLSSETLSGSARRRSARATTADQPMDDDMASAVQAALHRNPRLASGEVHVRVKDSVVTLRGTVQNLAAKRAALEQAWAVDGVESVRDRIRVDPGVDAPGDESIRQQVLDALNTDSILEGDAFAVDVDRGTVQLDGHVDSWFERGQADDVAARVAGVRAVDNDLIVLQTSDRVRYDPYVDDWSINRHNWYSPSAPTARRPDASIEKEIRKELRWSPFVDANRIDISVHAGVATLTGEVDSDADRRIATENAIDGGAVAVVNQLRIKGAGT